MLTRGTTECNAVKKWPAGGKSIKAARRRADKLEVPRRANRAQDNRTLSLHPRKERSSMPAPSRWILAGLVSLALTGSLSAETREFVVFIDGKPSGQYSMVIEPQKDGSTLVTNTAEVRVLFARITVYRYSYRGTELWKEGKLVRMDSATDDNGKQYRLQAATDGNRLRVRLNDLEYFATPEVWTTSYWRLANDLEKRKGVVPLLDADTGRILQGQVAFVGNEQFRVGGQVLPCKHYRLTGPTKIDLWYDASGLLVHQEALEDGHKTSLQLGNIAK
ncbi:MAG: DUF6134 family protein [Gemmataceae bacterium]